MSFKGLLNRLFFCCTLHSGFFFFIYCYTYTELTLSDIGAQTIFFFLINKSGIGHLGSAQAENVRPGALYLINVSCSSKTTNKEHFSSKVMNVESHIPSTSPQISLRNEDINGALLSLSTGHRFYSCTV